MERYITGTKQAVMVHDATQCVGTSCVIHNPSPHNMIHWPTHWRGDCGLMERICVHGVGHPDPDDIEYKRKVAGDKHADAQAVHGCDGCCTAQT